MLDFRTGKSGWSIDKAVSRLFPGPGNDLRRYARKFGSVEIESAFERRLLPATWSRWAASVRKDFRFSVQAPKSITHKARLAPSTEVLDDFLARTALLGEKLGPLVFFLPRRLAFEPRIAGDFLALLRRAHRGLAAIEPQHLSWFTPEADQLLSSFQIARVANGPGKVPAATEPGGWTDLFYYRLHGEARTHYYAYSDELIEELHAGIIRRNPPAGAWVIFDNDAPVAAARNALALNYLLTPSRF